MPQVTQSKGFIKPKAIKYKSFLIEFKRRYSCDEDEETLFWWRINIPKQKSAMLEEQLALKVCERLLQGFGRMQLKSDRRPNQIFLLNHDGGKTLAEGRCGSFEGSLPIDNRAIALLANAKS